MDEFSKVAQIPPDENRSAITLSMLFYFVTAAAILAACVRFLATEDDVTEFEIIRNVSLGGACGLFLGGLLMFRRQSHPWLAPLVGVIMGSAVGPFLSIRLTHFVPMLLMSFGGAWLLVVVMLLPYRLRARTPME